MKTTLKNLLQSLCNLIVRRVYDKFLREFYNKYLDLGSVNKRGSVDLENIGCVCNTKLIALTLLSIADIEVRSICRYLFVSNFPGGLLTNLGKGALIKKKG